MVIPTFPTLPGLSFPVKRTPGYATIEHKAVAGNSTTQSPQPFSIDAYELPFEFLRADNVLLEWQTLMSFYKSRRGKSLPFHFNDPDDNHVAGQTIGIGDGVTTDFAFVRTMVSAVDLIQDAVAAGLVVYVNAVVKATPADYTLLTTTQYATNYGVRFAVAPAAAAVITADFSYNWLCRFDQDAQEFSKFQYYQGSGLWEAKSIKFSTVLQ